jgi:ATP phosphoribosyltransferase regulatory subunit HisZ
MNISRRSLMATTVFVPVLLAACTSAEEATATVVVSQLKSYATYIDNAIDALADSAALVPLVSAADLTSLKTYAGEADAVFQAIAATASTEISLVSAQSYATALQDAFNSAAALLGNYGVKIPAIVSQVVSAAQVILPVLLSFVKLAPTTVGAPRQAMSVSEAESRLSVKPLI